MPIPITFVKLLDRRSFGTHKEAKLEIFTSIEGCYNPHRRHSAIDYLSPITTKEGL